MGFFLSLALRWGVPEPLRRLAAIGMAIVSAIALAGLLWGAVKIAVHIHDKGVIEKHEAGITAAVATATNAANEAARQSDAVRQFDNAVAAERADRAIAQAQASYPAEVKRQAGPAVRGVLEGLRK